MAPGLAGRGLSLPQKKRRRREALLDAERAVEVRATRRGRGRRAAPRPRARPGADLLVGRRRPRLFFRRRVGAGRDAGIYARAERCGLRRRARAADGRGRRHLPGRAPAPPGLGVHRWPRADGRDGAFIDRLAGGRDLPGRRAARRAAPDQVAPARDDHRRAHGSRIGQGPGAGRVPRVRRVARRPLARDGLVLRDAGRAPRPAGLRRGPHAVGDRDIAPEPLRVD